jgi:thiosulfate/3-mercaptopyruvate sulfurtransferase
MSNSIKEINTHEMAEAIRRQSHAVIDVRPIEAYNGWTLNNENRGGHISGAKAFSLQWTLYPEWLDLIKSKGITEEKEIIVYGYQGKDVEKMAEKLIKEGFNKVSVYNHFPDEWATDNSLPIDRLERYQMLVCPEWLHNTLKNESRQAEGKKMIVCHSHYGYRKDYDDGHIPGAIPLDTMELESPETWNRRSPEELEKALLKRGITSNSTVVVYGRFSNPDNRDQYPGQNAGHLGAMRCAAILLYAGVRDVRILNGGLTRWQEAGYELSSEETLPTQKEDFGAKIPGHPEIFVDMPKAKELLKAKDGELVSIRSWNEFIGDVSGYNYIGKTGRIPGAVFGNCGSDAYHMENYRNPDHTMREYHEVAANWAQNGILPEKHIAFYCGTGWRASEAFWNAYLMGWPQVSIYDGGWFEWSNTPNNPVETGEPK